MPIEWHKKCLRSRRNGIAYVCREIDALRSNLKRMQDEYDFLERQITEAEHRNKTEFDPEKFLVPRKPKL